MASKKSEISTTSDVIRFRERVGGAAVGVLFAWVLYIVGALPWALGLITGIESDVGRVVAAAGALGAAVLAVMNLGVLFRLVRPGVRKVVNYFTPVLPLAVAAERLRDILAKVVAIETRLRDVGALRAAQEVEVARLTAEEQAVLREASDPRNTADDATLGRRLNRAQEALRARQERLEEVRATEEMLLDAKEVCSLCAHRVAAARERFQYDVEIARTVAGVASLPGGVKSTDDVLEQAERACVGELDEVDLTLANLDSALFDRKLGDRAAALRIAELRQETQGVSGVRVDAAGEATEASDEVETQRAGERARQRGEGRGGARRK